MKEPEKTALIVEFEQSLLVLKINHNSAFALGIVSLAQAISFFLFTLVGGSFADRIDKRRLLVSFLVWAFALLLFALSHVLWLAMLALLLFGLAQNGVGATTITLMQTRVPPQMRGRVMSLNTLFIMGVRPLGDFPVGALIGLIGGLLTVVISAAIVGGHTLFLLGARPLIRGL